MNTLRNKVNLIGRLGAEPEMSTFENGNKRARFSIAVNSYYKDREGKYVQDTQWHNITSWGQQAEWVEQRLHKGQEVVIEGRLVNRVYEKDGEKKYATQIELQDFLIVGNRIDVENSTFENVVTE